MKQRKQNYITFVCVVFILLSCENQDNEITQTSTEQIQEARLWFEENYESFDFKNAIAPVWTKAIHHGHIIEVGFTVDGKLPVPKAPGLSLKFSGRQRLLIKKAGRSFELEIVSYIPSNKNKVNISGVNLTTWMEGFQGIIHRKLVSGEYHIEYISSGQIVARSGAGKTNPQLQGRSQGECVDWNLDTHWFYFNGSEWVPDGVTTQYLGCLPTDVEGGGGGYQPEDWTDSGNGGGGGGNPGSDSPYECIEITVTNECINNVAQHVLSPNVVSTYNELIQDVFNADQSVNLFLVDGPLDGNDLGFTDWAEITEDEINVTITIDPAKFTNTSKEFIAATIYHECLHALSNALSENDYSADDDHVAMFSTYLSLLASGLQAAYPNLSSVDAKGLILKGVLAMEGDWSTEFIDRIITNAGYTRSSVNFIKEKYKTTSSGTACE